MAYVKYTWQNLPNITTPIDKANLDHLETQYEEFTKLFNAFTILAADVNDTPAALTLAASTIVARLAAGGIVAATPAQIMAILTGQAGADFSMNTHKITAVVDPTADQHAATKKYVDESREIATGSYSGNGGAGGRQITTGFVPTLVWLKTLNSSISFIIEGQDANESILITANPTRETAVHIHATDGFTVGDGSDIGNNNGVTYYWWAISA